MLNSSDSFVRYEVGNPNFRGRTTVEVFGNGQLTVRFEQGERKDVYTGQLLDDQFVSFQQTLQANPPLSLESSQTMGKPGEDRIRLTIMDNGREETIEFWNSEQWQIPALRTLVTTFQQIASDISDGNVRY